MRNFVKILITASVFYFLIPSDAFAVTIPEIMCSILTILLGRIFRACCVIIIMGIGWTCFNGSISWQKAVTIIACLGVIANPKTAVIILLFYSTVTGVSGTIGDVTFYADRVYTVEEVLSRVCPSL
ncbi:TrbC/VirB2 family protein [Candidatus Deianiraea vastatrix]|uniref:Uncharacterized protein n=1 Tax=Candidatus Deianiraea vastatrix TaxID=2163644 RepID=A0A5B8XCT0_9RICK|nr:TrbC/VirB2 family protein [Candidatus Deianiraea vastatrix]QED23122.1 hypothetical protein Deia_00315 [Candidatus Deianiraea vastatrix]